MFKLVLRCVLIACLALLAGCPKSASKGSALDESQYAWSAAIRWGDFEGAWNLVDPEAVSYTHLDVYKRQGRQCCQRECGTHRVGAGE